jgi:hypothetical protein
LRYLSRWLILLILLVSVITLVRPVHAQVAIALSSTVINTYMGTYVTDIVTLTSTDAAAHTITLYISAGGPWWGPWWNPSSFSVNPVNVPAVGSATSTLTLAIPDICQGVDFPGPYPVTFAIEAHEGAVTVASASLMVNVAYSGAPLSISIAPSKASYIIGESVSLQMNSNLPAQYVLTIKKPDGSTWKSATGTLGTLGATFTKTATEPTGTYTAELTASYCRTAYASTSFFVGPNTYDVTITLHGLPTDATTALQVDGNKVADMKGGDVKVLTYSIGSSHTFQVDQYVSGAPGYQYYCEANTWTTGAEGSKQFEYKAQYYLDVSTDPPSVTDVTASGWKAAGSSVSISSVPAEVEGTTGTKYVFTTWTVDGTSRGDNGFIVVMDAPHKVVAKYDTMFLLTVVSDYGNPKGAGYYKSGDTATFSVDSPVGIGIQRVFVEWTGDFTGNNPQGSVTMDGPKTVTATWTTNYFQVYVIIGAIVAIAVVAGLLLWMRRRRGPAAVKPPPPSPPPPPATDVVTPPAESPAAPPATEKGSKPAVSIAIRCTNCGHELKEGQVYCPECGQKQID